MRTKFPLQNKHVACTCMSETSNRPLNKGGLSLVEKNFKHQSNSNQTQNWPYNMC